MTDPQYHLTCEVCGALFWSADAWAEECPQCSAPVATVIDKLYPATWDPRGADECGILYCAGAEHAFGIDPDAEAWWGPQLAGAINDAHDLRAEVARLRKALEFYADRGNYYPADYGPGWGTVSNDNGKRARAALEVQS